MNYKLSLQGPMSSLRKISHYCRRCRELDEVKNWLDKGFHIESAGTMYIQYRTFDGGGGGNPPLRGSHTSGMTVASCSTR